MGGGGALNLRYSPKLFLRAEFADARVSFPESHQLSPVYPHSPFPLLHPQKSKG